MQKNLFVSQPFLPPLEEYTKLLKQIWESKTLTNQGPLHEKFEKELASFLEVPFVSLMNNGTTALMCALKNLKIQGEIITTPYTFAATRNAIEWLNIQPVFVDIEPRFCNLNPYLIEKAITERTTAILPVHIYGNPCEMDQIETIAGKYNLKVIYDAAHGFGVKKGGHSILNSGNLSILSFHATKIFHTIEGGGVVCQDVETKRQLDLLRNFGIEDEISFVGQGINGKLNEFQSAMGLLLLKNYYNIQTKTKRLFEDYRHYLSGIPGIEVLTPDNDISWNYGYCPIFVDKEKYGKSRNELYFFLKDHGIHSRRYFHPLLSSSQMDPGSGVMGSSSFPVAWKKSETVLCLPSYPDLLPTQVKEICLKIESFKD